MDLNTSDHHAVMVTRKKELTKLPKIVGRLYKNYNKDFQDVLNEADWGEFYNSRDPNVCWKVCFQ